MLTAKPWRRCAAFLLWLSGFAAATEAAPVVISVTPPANGLYGDSFVRNQHYTHITVTFSEPITVTGLPTLGIKVGAASRQSLEPLAVWERRIDFGVAPLMGDDGALVISGPISLNGGTIRGSDGSAADLSFTAVAAPDVIFDYTPPAFPIIQRIEPASPTAEQAFTVHGTAEVGSRISTAREAPYLTVTTGANRQWAMTFPGRAAGNYRLYFYATDAAGNESHPQRGGANGVPVELAVLPAQPPPSGTRPQTIEFVTPTSDLASDSTLPLTATATSGLPVAFYIESGPAVLRGDVLQPTAASGTVTIRAVQAGDATYARTETLRTLTIFAAPRLINLSSRMAVGGAGRTLIAGFVVSGLVGKPVLVRGVGPGLTAFGVGAAARNPRVRIYSHTGALVRENDDWSGADVSDAAARVGAFALSAGSGDAALLVELPPGAYTLHVEAVGGDGVALAEIYDASSAPALKGPQMINLSTRGFVGTGEAVLTAGFVVTGGAPKRVLVRGIGPALASFGVTDFVADPVLRIHNGTAVVAENDDWETPRTSLTPAASPAEIAAAAAAAGAFALAPGARDAATVLTLPPGAYTASVSGAAGGTGTGLVEVYDLSTTTP